jgi:hypothetical protein
MYTGSREQDAVVGRRSGQEEIGLLDAADNLD